MPPCRLLRGLIQHSDFHGQPGLPQRRPQGQIEDRGRNHCHDGVHPCGEGGDFRQSGRDVLGHAQEIGLVEIPHQRVGHHIEGHAAEGGGNRGHGRLPAVPGLVQMADSVCHQPDNQSDAQLQEEGLGRAGHIGRGQVGDGHANRSGQAAPVAAQQQGRQHAEHIAEVEGGLLGPNGDVDFEEGEADVAKGRQQPCLGQALYVRLPGAGAASADDGIVDSPGRQQDGEEYKRQAVGIGTLQRQLLSGELL